MEPSRARMPNGQLYYSPRGLYPFQADAVARAVIYGEQLVTFDTGIGKTHVAMCAAAQMIDESMVDIVMMIGRRNKVARKQEFLADFEEFTSLDTFVYHGSGREKRLVKHGIPEVFITTYETGRAELFTMLAPKPGARSKGTKAYGSLVSDLQLDGKRVLWIFDEIAKLGNRSTELYKAYCWVIDQLAKKAPQYRLGLTATPENTNLEQPFNICRIVMPSQMPPIGVWTEIYTTGRDEYTRQYRSTEEQRVAFGKLMASRSIRKRITDPDVRFQMPAFVPDFLVVDMEPTHAKLYRAVEDLFGDDPTQLDPTQRGQLAIALKLTAGHPASHLHSSSQLSTAIVEAMGKEALRAIPSSKTLRLIEELEIIIRDQGAQVLVFTKYAETVLPEVEADLANAGYRVAVYSGGQTNKANSDSIDQFRSGKARVLLASDAAAEGLNLPEAHYIIEYESAETWTDRLQRYGRHQRITSAAQTVFGITMVLAGTREVGMVRKCLRRKNETDILLGDKGAEGHIDVSEFRHELREALTRD